MSEVFKLGDQRAIVITRYDCRGSERVHQEDLRQSLGVHPALKYQNEGGPTPSDISKMFGKVMSHKAAIDASNRFVDALLFNWLIGGTDAHAKNYSLLLAGSEVHLAPLYDIASALSHDDVYLPKAKAAMKIGSSYQISSISRTSREHLASEMGLESSWIVERGRILASEIAEAFHYVANDPAVKQLGSSLPDRLTQRAEVHAAACQNKLL